jgi:hypothetical protein
MADLFAHANQEHEEISKAVKTFAAAIGCEMSEQSGNKFARIVLLAVTQAAFEGANIFGGVARTLIVLRPKTFR